MSLALFLCNGYVTYSSSMSSTAASEESIAFLNELELKDFSSKELFFGIRLLFRLIFSSAFES